MFLMFSDNHHNDGRIAAWCAAAKGVQQLQVAADPENFFVPPYVGKGGWLGIRLDNGLEWDQVAAFVQDAYDTIANPLK